MHHDMLCHRFLLPAVCRSVTVRALFSTDPRNSKGRLMVLLHDSSGKVIGSKTMSEAESMAKKMNLLLRRKELPPGQISKHTAYFLYDPRSEIDSPVSVTAKSKTLKAASVRQRKAVTLGANISDHDIETKAKLIARLLKSNIEVQIVSYGSVTAERLEEIYQKLAKMFHELRIVQKSLKPGSLKFTILPDAGKFTGLVKNNDPGNDNTEDYEIMEIDDKEVEELVAQKLKGKKK